MIVGLPFENLKREVLVKKPAETSPQYGINPEQRSAEELVNYGVVNLNKPPGPTSHQTTDYAKKILGVQKMGHGGSLDPNVTGVLPMGTGKATRLLQTLLKAGKEYVCLMHMHKDIPEEETRKILQGIIGEIEQLPPVRSAVKRQLRKRAIYYLEVLEIDGKDVLFRIGCQAGTYIRKICDDFGKKIGCGAHMAQLVRTKAGPFHDKEWVTLHDLKDAYELWKTEGREEQLRKVILPAERATAHLPKVWIHDSAVDSMCHGAQLSTPGIIKLNAGINIGETVAVMTLKDEIVCLGEAVMDSQNMLKEGRGLAVKNSKVFMDPGTYPKWKKV